SSSIYYNDWLPTYYPSSTFWYDAKPINQCDTLRENRDIYLIGADSLMSGNLQIEGQVVDSIDEQEVAGLDLLLANTEGQLIQARRTDAQGRFQFENLAAGTYVLWVDLINAQIDNGEAPVIPLDGSANYKVFLGQNRLTLAESPNSTTALGSELAFQVFPNPGNQTIQMRLSPEIESPQVQIYNSKGQLVYSGGARPNLDINTADWPQGIYWIQLQSNRHTFTQKWIKR
ncbi:MAG: T9SS type A sorting domain-containing protein, partial [Bacteroidota bacterium]